MRRWTQKDVEQIQEYAFHGFVNPGYARSHLSPSYHLASPVMWIPEGKHVVNPSAYSSEDEQIARFHWVPQQIWTSINGFNWISNRFPDQMSSQSNSVISLSEAEFMTVEQTAAWVWKLCYVNGWDEADRYAESFRINDIWGYLLKKLSLECLKTDLGISKYQHRLKIMSAIDLLCRGKFGWDGADEAESSYSGTPRISHLPRDNSISMSTKAMHKKTQAEYSPKRNCRVCIDIPLENQADELSSKSTSELEQVSNTKDKSGRASPDNPVIYKTFYKVKVRSSKSLDSAIIGYFPKGSDVLVNQTKGRSGRVVFRKNNGELEKVGWVTLYTKDRQLLGMSGHKKHPRDKS